MPQTETKLGTPSLSLIRQVLGKTSHKSAANWFGVSEAELDKLLSGQNSMTPEIVQKAREILGQGSSPWLEGLTKDEVREEQDAIEKTTEPRSK